MENLTIFPEVNAEAGEIIVRCEGIINSLNSKELLAALTELLKEHPGEKLALDFEKLEYISSAGLRVLLQIHEAQGLARIDGVSQDAYETLEVTGFTTFIQINRKMKTISVEGCEKIAQGASGSIYRLDRDTIVKVFMPDESLTEIRKEGKTARRAFLYGIPTALSLGVVRVGDAYGLVWEMLKAESFSEVLKNPPVSFEATAKEYADLLLKLHGTGAEEDEFPTMKEIYHEMIDYSAKYFAKQEIEKFKALIDSIPDRNTLIHGDYHPGNIMATEGALMLIDLNRMGLGHPIFDLFEMAASHINLAQSTPQIAEMFLGIPAEMIVRLWEATLRNYFPDLSGADLQQREKQLKEFARISNVIAPAIGRNLPEEQILFYVNEARTHLLPIIDTLIGSVDW